MQIPCKFSLCFSTEYSPPASSPYFNWGKTERTRQGHVVYVYVRVSEWMHVSRWQQTGQLSSLQFLLLPWASRQINADESLSKGGWPACHLIKTMRRRKLRRRQPEDSCVILSEWAWCVSDCSEGEIFYDAI